MIVREVERAGVLILTPEGAFYYDLLVCKHTWLRQGPTFASTRPCEFCKEGTP